MQELVEAGPDSIVDQRYVVRRTIGEGSVSHVHEAEHLISGAKVALKTVAQDHLHDSNINARLFREARILGALHHPYIVTIHDAGQCSRHGPFLALEMVDGRPLEGVLVARQVLPVPQAVALVVQICEALDELERRQVVHRDVKPANVLINRSPFQNQVKLIGLRLAEKANEARYSPKNTSDIEWTIEYLAPERLLGRAPADNRGDLYALGVILYECLTGEHPFSGEPSQIVSNFMAGARAPSITQRRPEVPMQLEAIVRKCIDPDPSRRFARAHELGGALLAAMSGAVPPLRLLETHSDHAPAKPRAPTDPEISAQRRRQFTRAPYVSPVRLLFGSTPCDGRTEDISEGGALIVTKSECARDHTVRMKLPLPGSGRVVTVDGITRWVKTQRAQHAIGVEFSNLADDARSDIRTYVKVMSGHGRG